MGPLERNGSAAVASYSCGKLRELPEITTKTDNWTQWGNSIEMRLKRVFMGFHYS